MKTTLLFSVIILFFSAGVYAQPVLHAADLNPVAKDKFIQANAKVAGVATPKAGTNITWNYSKLKDTTYPVDTVRYVKKTTTPYASLFPQSNLAGFSSTNPEFYVYYKTSNTLLESFGSASATDTSTWVPPYRLAIFPATYGTNFTDTSTVTVKDGGKPIKEGYRDSAKIVGYGTLKLTKNRTFTNVIMVKTTTIISFTISGHTYVNASHSINFYVAGYHNPLLSFSINDANKPTFITYSKNAKPAGSNFDDDESSIAVNKNTAAFSLFPNPASSEVAINFNSVNGKKAVAISINDMNGKNVYTQKTNIVSGDKINCSAIKAGIYLVTIQMNDGSSEIQKLMITK